mgnify:CR=1 FL=1
MTPHRFTLLLRLILFSLASDILTGPFVINAANVDRIADLVTSGVR